MDERVTNWDETGTTPFLDEGFSSFLIGNVTEAHGDFSFIDLPSNARSINSVSLFYIALCLGQKELDIRVWDSGSSSFVNHNDVMCDGFERNILLPEITTVEEVNNIKFTIRVDCPGKTACDGNIQAVEAFLEVSYNCWYKENNILVIPDTCPHPFVLDESENNLILEAFP